MAAEKKGNRHLCVLVTLEEDGQEYTFTELGQKFDLQPGTVRGRWLRRDKPPVMSKAMVLGQLERPKGNKRETVRYGKHGEVTFTEISQKIHLDMHRSPQYFRARWAAFNRPEDVTEEMFNLTPEQVFERTGCRVSQSLRNCRKATNAQYLDPNFLPGVPFGDLANLSGDRNTGAARQGAEEFRRSRPGSSFSGRSSSSMGCYNGRQ